MADPVLQWLSEAKRAASRTKVPASVLLGLIGVESGGREGLTSSTGAQGLTQFEPGTAREVGVDVRPGHATSQIEGAAKYLVQLGFEKDPARALASYNAGPGNPAAGAGYAQKVLALARKYGALPAAAPVKAVASSAVPVSSSGASQVDPAALAALVASVQHAGPRESAQLVTPAFAARAPMAGQGLVTGGVQAPSPGQSLSAALTAIAGLGGGSVGSAVSGPAASPQAVSAAPQAPSGGVVNIDKAANRPGVGLTRGILKVVRHVAAVAQQPLTVGTGTNHSRMTVDGNVSDHWSGNATDIPATGDELIKLGQDALIAAGMPEKEARKQSGGLFNVPYGQHRRIQIIFNTHVGGDHTNHLHVGVSAL